MTLRLRLYVGGVIVAAMALLALYAPMDLGARGIHYLLWLLICFLSEAMSVQVLSGEGTTSMASTANLATAMLWGQGPAMWICAFSCLAGERLLLHKPWIRVLFNATQTAITVWAATAVFALLGGPRQGLAADSAVIAGSMTALHLALPVLGLIAVYLVCSRVLVAVAAAWATERSLIHVLRHDWFNAERLIEDMAAFLLAPVMVISYRAIQYLGVILFFSPLYMIHLSSRRYLEIRRTQDQLVQRERMAAMGQMAAGIGHNMRQRLAVISARAQMLLKAADLGKFDSAPRDANSILEESRSLTEMSEGLMNFAQKKLKVERVDMYSLLQRTLELAKTQKNFNGVECEMRLEGEAPTLRGDPVQLQQVLLNLFINGADAMQDKPVGTRKLTVTCTRESQGKTIEMRFIDTGSGIKPENMAKIFDPQFTTKATGHGFGLSTSYSIISNHGGKISAISPAGQGATFIIVLPLEGPESWS